MRIYITTHGDYDDNHISLCTIDFELAIKHFLEYSKKCLSNTMNNIEVWEDNNFIFDYGSMNYDIINQRKELTYKDIKEDFIKQFKSKVTNI